MAAEGGGEREVYRGRDEGDVLPDLPQARTPQPPSMHRPISGRPGSARLLSSSAGRPSPRTRPTTPNGRAVRLSSLSQRPESAGASRLQPRSPAELERLQRGSGSSPGSAAGRELYLEPENVCGARFGESDAPPVSAAASRTPSGVTRIPSKHIWYHFLSVLHDGIFLHRIA